MAELKKGDRVKVEFEGIYRGSSTDTSVQITALSGVVMWVAKNLVKRLGKTVRPGQVWERDSERFYVRHNREPVFTSEFKDPVSYFSYGVDLISFVTNRRAFHLPFGSSNTLEDEGFELVLEAKESE